jgi:urease accessory protein
MSEAREYSRPELGRWPASIELRFEPRHTKTVLTRRRHVGPLRVQKPFYPADNSCHVYLLHPPGGMTGRDDLSIQVEVAESAHAVMTTPAANKVYRSPDMTASVQQNLNVHGVLEWLPQGTILFGASRAQQNTEIQLAQTSRLMAWDVVSLGRPASGDNYTSGFFSQRLTVYLDGLPLFIDRQSWLGGDSVLTAPWGLGGHTVIGIFLLYPGDIDTVDRCRACIARLGDSDLSVTHVDGLVVIRGLATNAVKLQEQFVYLWSRLRRSVIGCAPIQPRIWAT